MYTSAWFLSTKTRAQTKNKDRVHQLSFVNDYLAKSASQQNNPINETFCRYVSSQEPICLHGATLQEGIELKDYLSSHLQLPHCIQWQYDNGIPVGKGKPIALTSAEIDDISFWLSSISGSEVSVQCVPVGALSYKKLLKSNEVHNATVYHVGESVAIQEYSDDSLQWVVEITKILSLLYEFLYISQWKIF